MAADIIEFPVFNLDITDAMNGIAGRFNGEITSPNKRTELSVALSTAVSRIYDELCNRLAQTVKEFKQDMMRIGKTAEDTLLQNITQEFDELLIQCENKEKEIDGYRTYAALLEAELAGLR